MTSKIQAIQTALIGDWNKAISLNLDILKESPKDIETLNRLAFAYTVSGKGKEAKIIYQKVLKIDGKNPIALKNLKRLNCTDKKSTKNFKPPFFIGQIDTMFIEESGKTKVIELVNVAEEKIISSLISGELLTLSIKRFKIFVHDSKKNYIGVLPDDIGKRLIKFLKGGNSYQVFVKAVENHKVTIFMREDTKSSRFKNQPSFIHLDKSKIQISKKGYSKNQDEEDDNNSDED